MGSFGDFYRDSGFMMHVVLLASLGTGALLLAQLVTGIRPLLSAVIGGLAASLALGLLGTGLGLTQVLRAVAFAAGDQKLQMMAVGTAEALGPIRFALWLAIPLAIGLGFALTLQAAREDGRPS